MRATPFVRILLAMSAVLCEPWHPLGHLRSCPSCSVQKLGVPIMCTGKNDPDHAGYWYSKVRRSALLSCHHSFIVFSPSASTISLPATTRVATLHGTKVFHRVDTLHDPRYVPVAFASRVVVPRSIRSAPSVFARSVVVSRIGTFPRFAHAMSPSIGPLLALFLQ